MFWQARSDHALGTVENRREDSKFLGRENERTSLILCGCYSSFIPLQINLSLCMFEGRVVLETKDGLMKLSLSDF